MSSQKATALKDVTAGVEYLIFLQTTSKIGRVFFLTHLYNNLFRFILVTHHLFLVNTFAKIR